MVVVIRSIPERVNFRNTITVAGGIAGDGAFTPSIIGILSDYLGITIGNSNNIALKVLLEIVGRIIEDNTADGVFVIIKRNQGVFAPSFPQDLGSIEGISVLDTINGFRSSDAIGVVGKLNVIVGFKLTALLPGEGMTQIVERVALFIVGEGKAIIIGEAVLPNGIVGISFPILGKDISKANVMI